MDAFELRNRLEAVRSASQESPELLSQQLAILEAAVEQMITSQPAIVLPREQVSARRESVDPPAVQAMVPTSQGEAPYRLSEDDAFYLEFEL